MEAGTLLCIACLNHSVVCILFSRSLCHHSPFAHLLYVLLCSCKICMKNERQKTDLSPPVNYFTDRSKAVLLLWIFYVFSVLRLLCLCARLFICALWSPAGKGLTSSLSFVVFYCELVTFPLVSWVRYGT